MTADTQLPYSRIYSLAFSLLLKLWWLRKWPFLSKIWNTLYNIHTKLYQGNIICRLHGHKVLLNNGHTYPLVIRQYPTFNNPLIELVYQSFMLKGSPITVIDVGAAVGDTILLLETNCPGMIRTYYAIDADAHFYAYQQHNLKAFAHKVVSTFALLSDIASMQPDVERTLTSTASATGSLRQANTLDEVILPYSPHGIHVLKVDVDGFDGKVIKGGAQVLSQFRPAIIFEWNTPYYLLTQNDPFEIFSFLLEQGYQSLVWFDNTGHFSHFSSLTDREAFTYLHQYMLYMQPINGHHYDVVALHKTSPINPLDLAKMSYAASKPVPY